MYDNLNPNYKWHLKHFDMFSSSFNNIFTQNMQSLANCGLLYVKPKITTSKFV